MYLMLEGVYVFLLLRLTMGARDSGRMGRRMGGWRGYLWLWMYRRRELNVRDGFWDFLGLSLFVNHLGLHLFFMLNLWLFILLMFNNFILLMLLLLINFLLLSFSLLNHLSILFLLFPLFLSFIIIIIPIIILL